MSRSFLRLCTGWGVGVFLLLAFLAPFPHDLAWGALTVVMIGLWAWLDGKVAE